MLWGKELLSSYIKAGFLVKRELLSAVHKETGLNVGRKQFFPPKHDSILLRNGLNRSINQSGYIFYIPADVP